MNRKVLSSLENLCARQECCPKDVRTKALKRLRDALGKEAPAQADEGELQREADEIMESLVANGYLSESRYAAAFAREKASLTGWGPVKIKYALAAKGINAEAIAKGLAEIDAESSSRKLSALLSAKKRSLQGDPQIRLKLIRFALSRGYDYDSVSAVLDSLD